MSKNIFDYSHVKSVSVWALQDAKTLEICGKIVCNWSDNPNGSVCTAQVMIFADDLAKYGFLNPPQIPYKSEFLKG